MTDLYSRFMDTVEERGNIDQVTEFLHWDQEVVMPPEGVKARSEQLSTLTRIKNRLMSSDDLNKMISDLEQKDLDSDQQSVLREIKREHERAREVSTDLLEEIAEKQSECLDTWKDARENENFSEVAPLLQELVELKREYAQQIDPEKEPYRVLFDDYEPYIELETAEEILEELGEQLSDLVDRIQESGADITKDTFKGDFGTERQEEFNQKLLDLLNYNRERGNLEVSEHPFTIGNQFDARVTTRYNTEDLSESIMPTIHEFGHALYILGLDQENYANPLGEARDFAVHESQSRLWENHVGRSKAFWKFLLPKLEEQFPEQFSDATVKDSYESINQYNEDNLIRVHADEVSYHLHIVLRFDLERKLINGDIEVEELPELWNQKMEKYLGKTPETDTEGVLQDIHWFQGSIGYFPTYSLGSVMSAQIFDAAEKDIDNLDEKIEDGEFEELREWLRRKIHSEGKRHQTSELIEKVTGEKPSPEPFLDYIEKKYTELYNL